MPTSWVTGKLKDANGNVASPDTLASKVYLNDDQTTVDMKLSEIESLQNDISTRLTNLRLATTSLANTLNGS